MHHVVEIGDGLSERLDTGSGTVFSGSHGDVNGVGSLEATGDVVLDFGGTLAEVGPALGVLEEAILGGSLSTPDDTGGGSAGVETGVGQVTLVGVTELTMNLGLEF